MVRDVHERSRWLGNKSSLVAAYYVSWLSVLRGGSLVHRSWNQHEYVPHSDCELPLCTNAFLFGSFFVHCIAQWSTSSQTVTRLLCVTYICVQGCTSLLLYIRAILHHLIFALCVYSYTVVSTTCHQGWEGSLTMRAVSPLGLSCSSVQAKSVIRCKDTPKTCLKKTSGMKSYHCGE